MQLKKAAFALRCDTLRPLCQQTYMFVNFELREYPLYSLLYWSVVWNKLDAKASRFCAVLALKLGNKPS